jgi:predicted nucleic acid-binding protein
MMPERGLPVEDFVVVDASVWVARLVSSDQFYQPVKKWMESQRSKGVQFVSPTLLLPEVGGAIARRTGNFSLGRRAIARLERLPGLRLVEMDNELVRDAALLNAKLGLRGADSLYVATAYRLSLPLVTFDVDQRERAQKQVKILNVP